ncbi:MAG: hypothetical protein DLM72_13605 [Candidatus Nitrosopolaris wilkensis]|nr:MAG: hypothetical protein DLM72_13605 [Candidatus Nitrosopolaris wilkensis]
MKSVASSSKNEECATKTNIGNIAKFDQLKYFCPYCKDEVDKRVVMIIVHEVMNSTNYPYQPVKSDPVILDDDTIFCCSECLIMGVLSGMLLVQRRH